MQVYGPNGQLPYQQPAPQQGGFQPVGGVQQPQQPAPGMGGGGMSQSGGGAMPPMQQPPMPLGPRGSMPQPPGPQKFRPDFNAVNPEAGARFGPGAAAYNAPGTTRFAQTGKRFGPGGWDTLMRQRMLAQNLREPTPTPTV
jgi:hypothetical protein